MLCNPYQPWALAMAPEVPSPEGVVRWGAESPPHPQDGHPKVPEAQGLEEPLPRLLHEALGSLMKLYGSL